MPRVFLDTNVPLYALDPRDEPKRDVAERLLAEVLNAGELVVSSQVLVEFANAALIKLRLPERAVRRQVELLGSVHVIHLDAPVVVAAVDARRRYQISFWDACILAAAESAGCVTVYSEDLNSGQWYGSVQVVNPFADQPLP